MRIQPLLIAVSFLSTHAFCSVNEAPLHASTATIYRVDGNRHAVDWWNILLTENEIKSVNVAPYPHFTDNPLLSEKMKHLMFPYLLPLNHPLKKVLDSIFIHPHSRVIAN
jgi:hypothetical protein